MERDLVEASIDWRRAIALFETIPSLDGDYVFYCAGCHAMLSSLAEQPGTEISAREGRSQAEQAIALLKKAVAMGYRDPNSYRTETALDPIRDRPDFRLLMMDLAMPAEPFGPGR